jgi:uncharacterized RDD family membrane protein YckC
MVTPADNNYAPPQSAVADAPSGTDVLASRGERFGASIIDGLLFTVPLIPTYMMVIPGMTRQGKPNALAFWAAAAGTGARFYLAMVVCLALLGINAYLVNKNGQSIGKKMLGIKVVRRDGSRATLARIFFLRNVLNSVIQYAASLLMPILSSLYVLTDLLFIFGNARRCVHDYLADTIVIKA